MKRLVLSTVVTSAALAASALGAAPANAAAVTCTEITLVAATATPNAGGVPHDIVDVATASASCTDLGGATHIGSFVFEWYYDEGAMPACPSTQSSSYSPANSSTITVEGHATCQRPSSSPAALSPRWVEAVLYVDGLYYSNATVAVIGS